MSQAQSKNLPAAPAAKVGMSLVNKFATKYSIDADKLLPILKATAFRLPAAKKGEVQPEVSNEQMAALLIVADQYKLNPFTKEIYAFPDKGKGIVPIVGIDGWARIINEHPAMDGFEFRESDSKIKIDEDAKECPEWIEAIIYRKDRSRAMPVREYLDECYRPPFLGQYGKITGPWQSHTKRFLRHKALMQAARIVFGFAGIYDEDEAKGMGWGTGDPIDISPSAPESYDTAPFEAAITAQGISPDDEHLAAFIGQIAEQNRFPVDKVKVEAAADIEGFTAGFKTWVEKNHGGKNEPDQKAAPAEKERPAAKTSTPPAQSRNTIPPGMQYCESKSKNVEVAYCNEKCPDRNGCPSWE